MSAAAVADVADAIPVRQGKKKLILIAGVALLVLALAGAGAGFWLWKKKQAALAAEEEGGDSAAAELVEAEEKYDPKVIPTFVPLDPFTVNLADRDAERYAQVGITLELSDAHQADHVKAFMPAIRNNILLVLADKTAQQMMDRNGKELLAAEIRRAAVKPLGVDLPMPELEPVDAAASGAARRLKKTPRRADDEPVPVSRVHFSNFIIQ